MLRAPHWIIDVTRPRNGCGGCTRSPMNSKIPAQATWKTADKSPWWLRSTRYNEPNGDYHANCYLDLWHSPPNENSVTWNDGSCSYHSKSYYCQLAKVKKTQNDNFATPSLEDLLQSHDCQMLGLRGKASSRRVLRKESS